LLIGAYLAAGPLLNLSEWNASANFNCSVLEAQAWLSGRMELSKRILDTALFHGHIYNVYPPLFTLFSVAALKLGQLDGLSTDAIYPPWYVLFVLTPLPFAGFWAFQQVLHRA